jgi:hypothetical protein
MTRDWRTGVPCKAAQASVPTVSTMYGHARNLVQLSCCATGG